MKGSRRSQSGSFTTTVKPQIYNFEVKSRTPRIAYKNCETDYVLVDGQITEPLTTEINWKPKIPTKKLFQEPKFLMSLERKKIRVINGLKDTDNDVLNQEKTPNTRRNRIKIRKEVSKSKRSQEDQFNKTKSNYIHNELFMNTNNQKQVKTPIVNFNLQHLILKRKTFKSEHSSRKKGSNNPYYSYISSDRFDPYKRNIELSIIDRPYIESRKTSIENNNYSVRTADVRSNLSLHQP